MPRGARTDTRADVAVAVACVVLALVLLILPATPRDRVAGVVRGNLVGPLVAMQHRASLARRSFANNDSIARTADSVVMRSQRLDALEAENARLRSLLGLGRALRWGFIPAEAIVGRGMGDDHSFMLTAGSRAGVERFSAVVAADGLVGMVTQVDERTSVAISWPHPDFRVSATTADGGAFGIVSAHLGSGAERYLLELHGVPFRAELAPGTPIVSSGLGGVFPRGVFIGTVLEEMGTTTGWSRSYLVRPAVRPAEVTQVMVLQPERNAEGVASVWSAANSPTRRVIAAGDSLVADSIAKVRADSLTRARAESLAKAADSLLRADSLARARGDTVPRS